MVKNGNVKKMTQKKIMYECGCVAGGDNIASFCPMHGYPIVKMCAYVDTCKLSAIFGGFPTCYDSWQVMEDDRESRCSVYAPVLDSKSPTPQ